MKKLKLAIGTMSMAAIAFSCQQQVSETEEMYTEIAAVTDSIETLNISLMDSLQALVIIGETSEATEPADTATIDSLALAEETAKQQLLAEQKMALETIQQQIEGFNNFDAEYAKGEMTEEDSKAKMTEIQLQQQEVLAQQGKVQAEIQKIASSAKKA